MGFEDFSPQIPKVNQKAKIRMMVLHLSKVHETQCLAMSVRY